MPIYLDYNATAPVYPEAIARMQELQAIPANASSVHSYGRNARKHLENARKAIANAISAWPNEVIFTASGTEANTTALRGFPGRRVLVSAIEHSSVLKSPLPLREGLGGGVLSTNSGANNYPSPRPSPSRGEGVIPVTPDGTIDLVALDHLLSQHSPALVSVMLANNETGVIQPVAAVSALCKKHNALLHCDAVQALGKIPVDFGALGADMMTIAGHKCGGPVGAAALIVRRELAFAPLLTGGGQELGRRAGTENIAAIAGFAVAMEKAAALEHMATLRGWLDRMEAAMSRYGAIIFGSSAERLPNTSCVAMPGVSQEVQLMDFDLKGFAISAGSACSSGRIEVSHVLTAMGVPKELASCAIRISGGWNTQEKEILAFTDAWKQMAEKLGETNKRRA